MLILREREGGSVLYVLYKLRGGREVHQRIGCWEADMAKLAIMCANNMYWGELGLHSAPRGWLRQLGQLLQSQL